MQGFPHHYRTRAEGGPDQPIKVSSDGLPDLETGPPAEFDGPGDLWSPETMLSAAVANCFILTFRALTRQAGMSWTALDVHAAGKLEKTREGLRFTEFEIRAKLTAPGVDVAQAEDLMHKAEKHCLLTRSLNGEITLIPEVHA
jgi:organic hydroperoxide reductase OsmC/OhrA